MAGPGESLSDGSEAEAQRYHDIRERALALLARREHAPAELRTKLGKHGFESDAIEWVLAALIDDGRLSPARYAEALVANRTRRGTGPAKIRAELAAAGLEGDEIEQALAEAGVDWVALAGEARVKRFGSAAPADAKARARQTRFLQRRGFTGYQIAEAFDD